MLSDIDISGAINIIVDAPVNTTSILSKKTQWDLERDIQNTMLGVRFKEMLYKYDIQARTAIINVCIDWAENFEPANLVTLQWFRQISTLNSTDLLNVGIIWEQLYKTVCYQDCFKKVATIIFLNT